MFAAASLTEDLHPDRCGLRAGEPRHLGDVQLRRVLGPRRPDPAGRTGGRVRHGRHDEHGQGDRRVADHRSAGRVRVQHPRDRRTRGQPRRDRLLRRPRPARPQGGRLRPGGPLRLGRDHGRGIRRGRRPARQRGAVGHRRPRQGDHRGGRRRPRLRQRRPGRGRRRAGHHLPRVLGGGELLPHRRVDRPRGTPPSPTRSSRPSPAPRDSRSSPRPGSPRHRDAPPPRAPAGAAVLGVRPGRGRCRVRHPPAAGDADPRRVGRSSPRS